jgi:hypothetical protein
VSTKVSLSSLHDAPVLDDQDDEPEYRRLKALLDEATDRLQAGEDPADISAALRPRLVDD